MSSNKTANLQLNQWQAGDAFLREEFNQDNGKIDAAVQGAKDANCMVKLLDLTTTADTQSIELDVSHIDWSQYSEVVLYPRLKSNNGDLFYCSVQINNVSGASYLHDGNPNPMPYIGSCVAGTEHYPSYNRCVIPCLTDAVFMRIEYHRANAMGNSFGIGNEASIKYLRDVKKITIKSADPARSLKQGAEVVIYGVKR